MSIDQDYEFNEHNATATMRSHRFAEVEALAKRLYGGVEQWTGVMGAVSQTIYAARAFDLAEEFLAERDRRKAAL